jgi:hypothetical protein
MANPKSKLNANIPHTITVKKAMAQIDHYVNDPHPSDPERRGGFFSKKGITRILNHKGCIGVRYHFAKTSKNGHLTLVISSEFPKDKNGKKVKLTNSMMANTPPTCPPVCD